MIKEISTDEILLKRKSGNVDIKHNDVLVVIENLIDTANDNKDICAGLAANQLGVLYNIFVIKIDDRFIPIVNPKVVCKTGGIKSGYESCLSRPDKEPIKVRRYKEIIIKYFNIDKGEYVTVKYKGFTSRVLQHEIDHCLGKLI